MKHSLSLRSLKACFAICVVAALCTLLLGCSGNSGEEVAIRTLVGTTMDEITQRTGSGLAFEFMNDTTRQELTAYGIDAEAFAASALERLTYEVGEIKGGSDEASVTLQLTNVSLNAAMERAAERFDAYSNTDEAQTLYDEEGEAALMQTLFSYLDEELANGELVTTSAELICTKVDDTWQVDPDKNAAFKAALYGN